MDISLSALEMFEPGLTDIKEASKMGYSKFSFNLLCIKHDKHYKLYWDIRHTSTTAAITTTIIL